jgi:uncharacterized protein YggU (UPF0235/DUF167 family)
VVPPDKAGTYTLAVGSETGVLTVKVVFTVSNIKVTPGEVLPGENVTVSVAVGNPSAGSASKDIILNLDGTVVQTKSVTVAGGATETVTFTLTSDKVGSHTVLIGTESGQFVVRALVPATFKASNLTVTPAEVEVGQKVTVSVLITNTGDVKGDYQVNLKINNVVVDTKSVSLAGKANETVTLTTSKDMAGNFSVAVDSVTGSFVVKVPVIPPPPPTNWALIIGIILGGIIVIVVAVLLVRRLRKA